MRVIASSNKLSAQLDTSILDFLEHGDIERIAREDRKRGYKTDRRYVSLILKGEHRNNRILKAAIDLALKRRSEFPKQALKPIAHAA